MLSIFHVLSWCLNPFLSSFLIRLLLLNCKLFRFFIDLFMVLQKHFLPSSLPFSLLLLSFDAQKLLVLLKFRMPKFESWLHYQSQLLGMYILKGSRWWFSNSGFCKIQQRCLDWVVGSLIWPGPPLAIVGNARTNQQIRDLCVPLHAF